MSFLDRVENQCKAETKERWKGTFRDFLGLCESGEYKHLDALAHERVHNMILDAGTETADNFGSSRKKYKFFEEDLYGLEESLDSIMAYIHSAAQRTETARRMLLLYGPVSSGKSNVVALLKRGLEKYSRTDNGAVFAIADSKMHESPFLLVPHNLRPDFDRQYKIHIEGELSPTTSQRLESEFQGRFLDYPIERIHFSESNRVGIGTWVPSDNKSQDPSELIGGIDFSKIQEYGKESDPRAYNFDGELNISNRGLMEFVEGIKGDEKLLRVLLTATQEKSIKAPRFGFIYVDSCIILHSNETEFTHFMNEKKYEAYHDRMVIVKVPYNLGVSNEVKIYNKLLGNSNALTDMHIAPHTIEVASMFAILSRLEPPGKEGGGMELIKKMKLYDQKHVKGFKLEEVPSIKAKSPREGMTGVSPRFIIDQICAAISKSKDEDCNFITPLNVLRQLNSAIISRDTFKQEDKNAYLRHIETARSEWNEMLRNDIQKAFFLSFEDEARSLFENYLDQIEAACSGKKPRDPVTKEEIEIDEKLMQSIEDHVGVTSSGRDDFRNEILRFVGSAARHSKKFDYMEHAQLREAIQKQLFQERQGVIRLTVSTRNPDPDDLRRRNDVIDRMVDQQGYTAASANEVLKYATAHLFDK